MRRSSAIRFGMGRNLSRAEVTAEVNSELASLQQERDHLQRELTRQQSLVRLAQRSVGLTSAAPPTSTKPATGKSNTGASSQSKKRRPRRPVARNTRSFSRFFKNRR